MSRRQDKRSFFRADVQLYKAEKNKNIEPNTYVFPFSIPLPKSLPASRTYEDSQGSFRIEYNLKLKSGGQGKFPNKRTLDVASSSRADEAVPCLLQPKPIIPAALGIEGKGPVFLGAHVKDTNVLRGQELQVSLACRNESTLRIDRAVVSLEEEYYYTTKSFGGHGELTIFEREDLKRLPGIRVVGLHSSEVDTKDVDEETIARRMFKDLKAKGNIITLRIPETSKESYSGLILQISHYLKFSLFTKTEEEAYPSIIIPIHIGSEPPAMSQSQINFVSDHVSDTARIKFPLATALPDSIVLGRNADVLDNEESFSVPIPVPNNAKPSMIMLREELAATINDFDFITEKMKDLDWAIFLASLTPVEFGSIIALVGSEFAQPRVASLLAQNYGGDFTCAHCAAAIKNVSPVFRSNVVEGLLSFCSDLSENNHLIRGQLSDFEQIIVALHALNEDDAPEDDDFQRERTSSTRRSAAVEVPSMQAVPTAILIGGEDGYESDDKPPSELSLETALKKSEMNMTETPLTTENGLATKNQAPAIMPRRTDVLLGVADHPQTFKLLTAINEVVDKGDYQEFCPPVYRDVKKQFPNDQRFLIAPSQGDPQSFREATKLELIEHVGNIFDKFNAEKIYEDQPEHEGKPSGSNGEKKNWQAALKETLSDWELALTIHTYTSGAKDGKDKDANGGPAVTDICFFKAKHLGNAVLVKAIRSILQKDPETIWSPPIYRAIKKAAVGRRMFISVGDRAWREATQAERRENMERYFDLEKKRLVKKEKSHRRVASKEGSGHLRDKQGSGHQRASNLDTSERSAQRPALVKRRSRSREMGTRTPGSPTNSGRNLMAKEGRSASKSSLNKDSNSERLSRRTTLRNTEGGEARRSRSAGKYNATEALASPSRPRKPLKTALNKEINPLGGSERNTARNNATSAPARRSNSSAGKFNSPEAPVTPRAKLGRSNSAGRFSRDQGKAATQGSVRKKVTEAPPPVKNIQIVDPPEPQDSVSADKPSSQGEMALNDAPEDSSPKKRGPGLFRRLSRNNSIRTIQLRNMRHPRDMDVCFGSGNHPGTIALTEAVIKSMHKFSPKGWGPPVYKAIRSDLQGRRFFVRPDLESPWREASAEEKVELTRELFEAKRKERRR